MPKSQYLRNSIFTILKKMYPFIDENISKTISLLFYNFLNIQLIVEGI